MTREELKKMMPVIQAYVDDEKREVIDKELEKKVEEQPCVTIDDIIDQIEADKNKIESLLRKVAIAPKNYKK